MLPLLRVSLSNYEYLQRQDGLQPELLLMGKQKSFAMISMILGSNQLTLEIYVT